MNRRRVCTTISVKHWEILKKHTAKYETQQKVLEAALDCLDNNTNQNPALSPIEQLWLRACRELKPNLCIINKVVVKELMRSAGFELVNKVASELNLAEYNIVLYNQKPLKECSLKEVMDGLVLTFKVVNLFDAIDYEDCDDHYLLKIIHTLGLGRMDASVSLKSPFQKLFETYGAKTECEISESSIFMKIYKKEYSSKSDQPV